MKHIGNVRIVKEKAYIQLFYLSKRQIVPLCVLIINYY